ncbi:hypothetical protein [Metabacillus sp. SLBN-84]
MPMRVKYALFAVTASGDPGVTERELIADFDEEVHDHEVEEIVKALAPSDLEYDYVIVEKQFHREE